MYFTCFHIVSSIISNIANDLWNLCSFKKIKYKNNKFPFITKSIFDHRSHHWSRSESLREKERLIKLAIVSEESAVWGLRFVSLIFVFLDVILNFNSMFYSIKIREEKNSPSLCNIHSYITILRLKKYVLVSDHLIFKSITRRIHLRFFLEFIVIKNKSISKNI